MSVGYDLAGIQSDKVAGFIDAMHDATDEIERLRAQIPDDSAFAQFRDIEFPSHISDTITLSTFHGCPPDEIEAITKHLIARHDIDVIVKLNPTLLGPGRRQLDRPRHARLRRRPTGADGVRRRPAVRSSDHTDRRTAPVRARPRPPVRHQAHQHAGGPQPQGLDARRDDVSVRRTTARARDGGARPARDRAARAVDDPRPRRPRRRPRRPERRRGHHGQLLGGGHQGEPRRHDRDGRPSGKRVFRPPQAGWLRPPRPDAQGTDQGRPRRAHDRPRRLPRRPPGMRLATPATTTPLQHISPT